MTRVVTHELERANQMDGIINVKKEAGMTSQDVVFKLRKILGTKKIGHGGTLDPDVVGVLPIAVGKAIQMVEFMQDEGKIYEGRNHFGLFYHDGGCKWGLKGDFQSAMENMSKYNLKKMGAD